MPVKLVRKKALSNSAFFQSPTVHFDQIFARKPGAFNIGGNLRDVSFVIDGTREWSHLAGENAVGNKGDLLIIKKLADGTWQLEITQFYATQTDLDAASVPAEQTFADADLPTNILGTGVEPTVAYSFPDNQPVLPATLPVLKQLAWVLHNTLETFMDRLLARDELHTAERIDIVRNHIAYAHHASFLILNKNSEANGISNLTIQQRIDWCVNSLLGPSNLTDVTDLSDSGRALTADQLFDNLPVEADGSLSDPPESPVVWCDPRTGRRIQISEIEAMSVGEASFTPAGYTSATTGLKLELPSGDDYSGFSHRGLWINSIAS